MIDGLENTDMYGTTWKIFIEIFVPPSFNSRVEEDKKVCKRNSYLENVNELHLVQSISNILQAFDIVLISRFDRNLRTPPKYHDLF